MTLAATQRSAANAWTADPITEADVSLDLLRGGDGPSPTAWCSAADRVAARRWIEDLHRRNAPRVACLQQRTVRIRAANAITLSQGSLAPVISLFPAAKAYGDGWPVLSVGATVIFGQRVSNDDDLFAAVRSSPAGGYLYIGDWPGADDPVSEGAVVEALTILAGQQGDGHAAVVDSDGARPVRPLASRIVCADRTPEPSLSDLASFMADPTGCRRGPMDPGGFRWTYRVSYPDDGREARTVTLDPHRLRLAAMLLVPDLSP